MNGLILVQLSGNLIKFDEERIANVLAFGFLCFHYDSKFVVWPPKPVMIPYPPPSLLTVAG